MGHQPQFLLKLPPPAQSAGPSDTIVPGRPHTRHALVNAFKLLKPLGHGSMGTVFLAELRETKTLFALKIMSKEALLRGNAVNRAATEKEILSTLRSPYLLSLRGHFETDEHQILVLDYCSGGDLNELRQKQPGKKISEEAARFYAAEIVLALDHLHKHGFVYRDLKPENVLINASGHIQLTDFDLCLKLSRTEDEKVPDTKQGMNGTQCMSIFSCIRPTLSAHKRRQSAALRYLTSVIGNTRSHTVLSSKVRVTPLKANKDVSTERSRSFVGTDEYIAPEIIWGTAHDKAVDWWALGVVLYELVHGTTPFRSFSRTGTLFNIVCKEPRLSAVSAELEDLIRRLLIKEASERLGSREGAYEIKSHPFFNSICWDAIELMSRPPYVPLPMSQEETESLGKEVVDFDEYMAEAERVRVEANARRRSDKVHAENDRSGDDGYRKEQKSNSNTEMAGA